MKKFFFIPALVAGSLLATGCVTNGGGGIGSVGQSLLTGQGNSGNAASTGKSDGAALLGSLLGELLGQSATLTEKSLVGTWEYTGSDCVFESESLLAQAGGAVAANRLKGQLNTQLEKIGIRQGTCSFIFRSDNTYEGVIGGHTIQGNYTLDAANKKVKMTYLGGLGSMTPHVSLTGNRLSLLMESDKTLALLKAVAGLGKSSTMTTVSSLMNNYKGMYIGIELKK